MKTKSNKWCKKRHKFVFALLRGLLGITFKIMYGYKAKKIKLDKDKGYFILSNHQALLDPFFLSLSFNKPIYFVATDNLFTHKFVSKLIIYLVNPIPKRKAAIDATCLKNCLKVAKEEKLTIEQAARKVRYGVFETVIKKGLVDKIALAHHLNDQAETVLLNIVRGAGLNGAKGMEPTRDGIYIRPLLTTPREEIMAYLDENGLNFVEDETNKDNSYSRNYIRNVVLPDLRKHFKSVDKNIVKFASICNQDDNFINSQLNMGTLIETKEFTKKWITKPLTLSLLLSSSEP